MPSKCILYSLEKDFTCFIATRVEGADLFE
jgi:hypothetical protein